MNLHTAFDAWKNFILVLAGVLAGEMFSSFGQDTSFIAELSRSLNYYTEFDLWFARLPVTKVSNIILVMLILVYFLKCMHGFLVAIYSPGFYETARKDIGSGVKLLGVATTTLISLALAPGFARMGASQTQLISSSVALLFTLTIPSFLFLALDFERYFHLDPSERTMLPLIFRKPAEFVKRLFAGVKRPADVVATWLFEDAIIAVAGVAWAIIMFMPSSGDVGRIIVTLALLATITFVQGPFDYFANRGFFFRFAPEPGHQSRSDIPSLVVGNPAQDPTRTGPVSTSAEAGIANARQNSGR